MHTLAHILGLDNPAGYWYGFWSGSGSVIIPPLLTAAPIVLVMLRRHNCHQHRCWRMGRHPVDDTGVILCRRHHPDDHLTADQVAELADRSRRRR